MAIPVTTAIDEFDTLEGELVEGSIGDPRFVMRSLSDLYEDVTTAVIREYSTNARDAMDEAGNKNPILVTLPNALNAEFRVKDAGIGMSYQKMKDTYLSFGDSTKRNSNAVNGMLGFGSKSGLAYTTQFTVTSIKDGEKTVAVVTRRPDYSLAMKLRAVSKTTEPNGTEVVIPVHNWQEFAHKAADVYKWWLPGTVLVNGKEPDRFIGEKIGDNMYYSEAYGESYVVMGHVAYPITNSDALFRELTIDPIDFILYVPNGDVEFANDREGLKYTEHTKAGLKRHLVNFEKEILAKAKDEIDNAPGFPEAYNAWVKWTNALGSRIFGDLTYRGVTLDHKFPIKAKRYKVYGSRNTVHTIYDWNIAWMSETLVVTNYTYSVASAHKGKVKEYAEKMYGGYGKIKFVLFTEDASVDSPWVDPTRVVTWDAVKKEIPTVRKNPASWSNHPYAGRVAGSWDYYDKTGQVHREKDFPSNKKVYYITLAEDRDHYSVPAIAKATKLDGPVVIVPANRLAKLKRERSDIKHLIPAMQKRVVKDGQSLLSPDAVKYLKMSRKTQNWVNYLDAKEIDDPEFKELSRVLKTGKDDPSFAKYQNNINLANQIDMRYAVKQVETESPDSWFNKYPLLKELTSWNGQVSGNKKHLYLYINAAYAAREEK